VGELSDYEEALVLDCDPKTPVASNVPEKIQREVDRSAVNVG
jgi:hypothetical protein